MTRWYLKISVVDAYCIIPWLVVSAQKFGLRPKCKTHHDLTVFEINDVVDTKYNHEDFLCGCWQKHLCFVHLANNKANSCCSENRASFWFFLRKPPFVGEMRAYFCNTIISNQPRIIPIFLDLRKWVIFFSLLYLWMSSPIVFDIGAWEKEGMYTRDILDAGSRRTVKLTPHSTVLHSRAAESRVCHFSWCRRASMCRTRPACTEFLSRIGPSARLLFTVQVRCCTCMWRCVWELCCRPGLPGADYANS